MAGANPTLPGGTALDRASFLVEVNRAGAISSGDITAAKDNKDQMRVASRAISDLNTILQNDNRALNIETQTRVLEALRASPGHRDIIADFVRKKMVDPSMSINEHSGMVTGRMLGMRPALESIAPIAPQFRQSVTAAVTTPVPPKNLSELGILPTGTDLAEDYNRAKSVLDYIRNSAQAGGPQENKLNPGQMTEVIGAWRRAGYSSFATIMDEQRRNSASGGDPVPAQARALVALNTAYTGEYERRQTVDVQGDVERARQRALQHLNVDYAQIRQRIPEILAQQRAGQGSAQVLETERQTLLQGARNTIGILLDPANPISAEQRRRDIGLTVERIPEILARGGPGLTAAQKDAVMKDAREAIADLVRRSSTLTPEQRRQEVEQLTNSVVQRVQGLMPAPAAAANVVTEAQKDSIMQGVQAAINRIADGFSTLTPQRQREIEQTINTRIEQAVNAEAAKRLGNTDQRVQEAQQGAQSEADARSQAFIERVRAMPPEQRERLCENSGSNPLVQQACKP